MKLLFSHAMFKHAVLIFAATVATTFGAPKVLFEVQLEDVPSGGLVCQVTFFGVPPAPATVDKIVRDSLQSAALVAPTRDILAMAFRGDDTLNSNQYSGALIYWAADKRIVTLEESRVKLGESCSLRRHHILHAAVEHRDHVDLPFDDHRLSFF